jgi:hypothetical protein
MKKNADIHKMTKMVCPKALAGVNPKQGSTSAGIWRDLKVLLPLIKRLVV